jgi:hypothetical protein
LVTSKIWRNPYQWMAMTRLREMRWVIMGPPLR